MLGTAAPETHPNLRTSTEPGSEFSALTWVQRICRISSIPLFGILGKEETVDNSDAETMVWRVTENGPSWTNPLLRTKSCFCSMKFHCLLVIKVCVDSGSVTQKYMSLLSSENPLALQCNLANGDGEQVH